MKRVAVSIAVAGFFVLAFIGWASGLPPEQCALKASLGAVALFVLARIAGAVIVDLMVATIVQSVTGRDEERNDTVA